MAALTAFYDFVLPNVPGLDKPLALQTIREAVVAFCERALVYTYDATINVVAATHTYILTPQADTRVVDILSARYDGDFLEPTTEDELDNLIQEWRTTATGAPTYYYSTIDRASIRLIKTPDVSLASGLEVKVAQAPTYNATTVPDWMLERFRSDIAHGAFQLLYAMKKKPWTDDDLAVYHGHLFDQAIGQANASKAKGHTRKRLRSTPVFR